MLPAVYASVYPSAKPDTLYGNRGSLALSSGFVVAVNDDDAQPSAAPTQTHSPIAPLPPPPTASLPFDEEAKLVYGVVLSLRNMIRKLSGKYVASPSPHIPSPSPPLPFPLAYSRRAGTSHSSTTRRQHTSCTSTRRSPATSSSCSPTPPRTRSASSSARSTRALSSSTSSATRSSRWTPGSTGSTTSTSASARTGSSRVLPSFNDTDKVTTPFAPSTLVRAPTHCTCNTRTWRFQVSPTRLCCIASESDQHKFQGCPKQLRSPDLIRHTTLALCMMAPNPCIFAH